MLVSLLIVGQAINAWRINQPTEECKTLPPLCLLLFSIPRAIVLFEAGVVSVVIDFHAPFGNFEEDSPIIGVIDGIKVFNELLSRLFALGYVLVDYLVILNQISLEVLHYVAMSLLQLSLLHEFEDSHVVDHMFKILFSIQVCPSLFELVISKPVLLVVWPFLE